MPPSAVTCPPSIIVASRGRTEGRGDAQFTDVNGTLGDYVPYPTDNDTKTYGLQVTVPIFSGGLTQSRVREQQYRWIAAKERVTSTSRATERAARDAYLGVISEIARVQALKQALESNQTSLKATEAGYEVGTRTSVDVLDARRLLVQAPDELRAEPLHVPAERDQPATGRRQSRRADAGRPERVLTESVPAAPTQPNAPPPPPASN